MVARPDDQAGADDRGTTGQRLLCGLFRQGLQRSVVFAGDLLGLVRVLHHRHRRGFIGTGLAVVGIHRDRGNDDVLLHALGQQASRARDIGGKIGGRIQHRVPAPITLQRGQVALAVTLQLLDVVEFFAIEARGIALAAIEQGQLVALGTRHFHEMRTQEASAAKHQDIERLGRLDHGAGTARQRQPTCGGGAGNQETTTVVHAGLPSAITVSGSLRCARITRHAPKVMPAATPMPARKTTWEPNAANALCTQTKVRSPPR